MKICIVGPGFMSIPPKGWGAIEILVNDYRDVLSKLGHSVHIVNTKDPNMMIYLINSLNPDFVHIQYEEYSKISSYIKCKNIATTSHYAYLEQPHKWNPGYKDIFWNTVNSGNRIFALSERIGEMYVKAGVNRSKIKITPNGVRTDLYRFTETPRRDTETIYLAKIDERKRQSRFQDLKSIKFVGNIADNKFIPKDNYLGEWTKKELYNNLTEFANLVLLSDGEAHPLVCMEALTAGLGLVISEWCTANIDSSLPFIKVIPESKINDIEYIKEAIEENRKISLNMRKDIKEYSKQFDWQTTIKHKFLPIL